MQSCQTWLLGQDSGVACSVTCRKCLQAGTASAGYSLQRKPSAANRMCQATAHATGEEVRGTSHRACKDARSAT